MTPRQIIVASAAHFNMSAQLLTGKRRTARIATARNIAMWLCRSMLELSYPAIAHEFRCDHTTVLYACKRVQTSALLMSQAAAVKERAETIKDEPTPAECRKCKSHEYHLRVIVRELAALVEKLGKEEAA